MDRIFVRIRLVSHDASRQDIEPKVTNKRREHDETVRRIHKERREQKARDQSRIEMTRDEVQAIIRYMGNPGGKFVRRQK